MSIDKNLKHPDKVIENSTNVSGTTISNYHVEPLLIKIAVGQGVLSKQVENLTLTYDELKAWVTKFQITSALYNTQKKADQGNVIRNDKDEIIILEPQAALEETRKAAKNKLPWFIGGHSNGKGRKIEDILFRSLITLDVDRYPGDLSSLEADLETDLVQHKYLAYSTCSHTPSKPKIRIIIFLKKNIATNDYDRIARNFTNDLSFKDAIDEASYKPAQIMFISGVVKIDNLPTEIEAPAKYIPWIYENDGELVDPQQYCLKENAANESYGDLEYYRNPSCGLAKEKIESWLERNPAEDMDYDQWLEMGVILFNEYQGDEEGLELWIDWSKQDIARYKPEECEYKWSTFEVNYKNPKTFRSLFYKQNIIKEEDISEYFDILTEEDPKIPKVPKVSEEPYTVEVIQANREDPKVALKLSKVKMSSGNEEPLPLRKVASLPSRFPVEALGDSLMNTALSIEDVIQCPLELSAQSILSTVSLISQAHTNIELPIGTGQRRPISCYFATVAASGERKDSSDNEALKGVREWERSEYEKYLFKLVLYQGQNDIWEAEKKKINNNKKLSSQEKRQALDKLAPPPDKPIQPVLIVEEPSIEGIHKYFEKGSPTLGLISSEGGQFISGYSMSKENKIKTSGALSCLWDGKTIKRMRGEDGTSFLKDKRLTFHLMFQPGIYEQFLGDEELFDQGLLSRILCCYPTSNIGKRFRKNIKVESIQYIKNFQDYTKEILDIPLPETPREIKMSDEAKESFFEFADEVEELMKTGSKFENIKGFASKTPEHAARLGLIIQFYENPKVENLGQDYYLRGKKLALYYAEEALRLFGNAKTPHNITIAEKLLERLKTYPDDVISLPDIYQTGYVGITDKRSAESIVKILCEHKFLIKIKEGALVKDQYRRDAYLIRKEFIGKQSNIEPTLDNFRSTLGSSENDLTTIQNTDTLKASKSTLPKTLGSLGTLGEVTTQKTEVCNMLIENNLKSNIRLIHHTEGSEIIYQRSSDGYVNATAMCKAYNKLFGMWYRLPSTKAYIDELKSDVQLLNIDLIQIIRGGTAETQGTWVHPEVAVEIASWLSLKFKIKVNRWIVDWMTDKKPVEKEISYHLRRYINNMYSIPSGYFSVLQEMTILLIGPLEHQGCILPSNIIPDISEGKMFISWLKGKGENIDELPTYLHRYEDGRIFKAKMYPNKYLLEFRDHFSNVWLPERAAKYFEERCEFVLPYLNKILQLNAPNYLKTRIAC